MQPFDRNKRWPKIGGSAPLWGGGGWVPIYHKLTWAETYLRTNGILMHPAVCPFSGGSWVAIEHKVAWAKENLHTKWHLSPSSRLTTRDIGRKLGGCAPLEVGSWVSV